jgi:Ala-tRNA(Pro) deacylase
MAGVLDYLQGRGVVFTVIPRSASEDDFRANAPDELIVTTVVAIANDGPVLLVIPAGRAIEPALVAEAVGDPDARLATEEELATRFPDYEVGALPPFSMLLLAPMYVDPLVIERPEIVFNAGRTDVAVKMSTGDLVANDPVVIAPLTSHRSASSPS